MLSIVSWGHTLSEETVISYPACTSVEPSLQLTFRYSLKRCQSLPSVPLLHTNVQIVLSSDGVVVKEVTFFSKGIYQWREPEAGRESRRLLAQMKSCTAHTKFIKILNVHTMAKD